MSGWDMSSTPTWGPNDGPEESTQSFPVPGTGARDFGQDLPGQDFEIQGLRHHTAGSAANGFHGESAQNGPPPEFFGSDYDSPEAAPTGPGGFPRRTPGQSMREDLPRRESR